jgi:hypothetical protein
MANSATQPRSGTTCGRPSGRTGYVADPAVRAVAAHKVSGGHPVRPVRAAHVRGHRGVILAQPYHLLSAADLGAELAGAFVEQTLEWSGLRCQSIPRNPSSFVAPQVAAR